MIVQNGKGTLQIEFAENYFWAGNEIIFHNALQGNSIIILLKSQVSPTNYDLTSTHSWFPLQILNMVNTFKMHLFCIYFTFR